MKFGISKQTKLMYLIKIICNLQENLQKMVTSMVELYLYKSRANN